VAHRGLVEILRRKLGLAPAPAIIKTRMGTEKPILIEPTDELTDPALLGHVTEFYHEAFCNGPRAMQYLQKRGCFRPEAVKCHRADQNQPLVGGLNRPPKSA
jgi:hypothetical protein